MDYIQLYDTINHMFEERPIPRMDECNDDMLSVQVNDLATLMDEYWDVVRGIRYEWYTLLDELYQE